MHEMENSTLDDFRKKQNLIEIHQNAQNAQRSAHRQHTVPRKDSRAGAMGSPGLVRTKNPRP